MHSCYEILLLLHVEQLECLFSVGIREERQQNNGFLDSPIMFLACKWNMK